MIASDAGMDVHLTAAPPDAEAALRSTAEATLHRELPLDAWFLFVEAHRGSVHVSGLALSADTAERVRRALRAVPGISAVETDLLPPSGWPRSE